MIDGSEFDYAFERSHAVYLWCLHVVTITRFLVNPLIIFCIAFRSPTHIWVEGQPDLTWPRSDQGRPDRTYCHPLLDKIGKSVKLDKGQSDLGRFRSRLDRPGRPGLGQPGLRPIYAQSVKLEVLTLKTRAKCS